MKDGQKIKEGDLLVEADLKKIMDAGLDITTPVIIANTAEYKEIKKTAEEKIQAGDVILYCTSK